MAITDGAVTQNHDGAYAWAADSEPEASFFLFLMLMTVSFLAVTSLSVNVCARTLFTVLGWALPPFLAKLIPIL